ncbi:MAG: substrate-binding domain-containing protein [Smithellaceae bacterium]|nr:substrate-binding domain-containing protein [Smithellaceae bacterium]
MNFAEGREGKTVLLATGTSIMDSGLLDDLRAAFEKKTGYRLKPLAIGSGQAMAMGERGEVDVLLVHDPASERQFITAGHGINRRLVMYNDYYLVGPPADPARVAGAGAIAESFRRIAAAGALFISRGDHSGNDRLEKVLWRELGLNPETSRWYQETGLGMGHSLQMAADKKAYALVDRATHFAFLGKINLRLYVKGGQGLVNLYHVIEVNPARWPKVNRAGARAFSEFLMSDDFQRLAANFGRAKYGETLFHPGKGKKEEDFK